MYHCQHSGCTVKETDPALINHHWGRDHNGDGGPAATRQCDGPSDPAKLRQETTTTADPKILKVLNILEYMNSGSGASVRAFVQIEESGGTKQWSELYSLVRFNGLGNASAALEEFRQGIGRHTE
jgi:hypothetical protein